MPPIFRICIELFLAGCSSAEPTSSSLNKTNLFQILLQKPTIFDHIATFLNKKSRIAAALLVYNIRLITF